MATVTNRLEVIMAERGMTIPDVSEATGLWPNTIVSIKKNRSVTVNMLKKLCDGLEIHLTEFYEITPQPRVMS